MVNRPLIRAISLGRGCGPLRFPWHPRLMAYSHWKRILSLSLYIYMSITWNPTLKPTVGTKELMKINDWLVVSTPLKHISQIGSFSQEVVKIKHIWNHQPEQFAPDNWWKLMNMYETILAFWTGFHLLKVFLGSNGVNSYYGKPRFLHFQGLFHPYV